MAVKILLEAVLHKRSSSSAGGKFWVSGRQSTVSVSGLEGKLLQRSSDEVAEFFFCNIPSFDGTIF